MNRETYKKAIENSIRGIRLGTKTPKDVGVTVVSNLGKLKLVDEPLFDELLLKYKNVVGEYNKKLQK